MYQFESICRNKLGYEGGLLAVAADPMYDAAWSEWIKRTRLKLGAVDFGELIWFHSEQWLLDRKRHGGEGEVDPAHAILFGAKEGRIAAANRGRDPLHMFAALQRHLGYPRCRAAMLRPAPRNGSPCSSNACANSRSARNFWKRKRRGRWTSRSFTSRLRSSPTTGWREPVEFDSNGSGHGGDLHQHGCRTDGPIPGPHSMLSFASAAYRPDKTLAGTFEANLETLAGAEGDPRTMAWWKTEPEAWAACRRDPRDPAVVMPEYVRWIKSLPGKPVFVAYPAGFDFLFVYWYLIRFAGESPFSHSALDMKTYAMAVLGKEYRESTSATCRAGGSIPCRTPMSPSTTPRNRGRCSATCWRTATGDSLRVRPGPRGSLTGWRRPVPCGALVGRSAEPHDETRIGTVGAEVPPRVREHRESTHDGTPDENCVRRGNGLGGDPVVWACAGRRILPVEGGAREGGDHAGEIGVVGGLRVEATPGRQVARSLDEGAGARRRRRSEGGAHHQRLSGRSPVDERSRVQTLGAQNSGWAASA